MSGAGDQTSFVMLAGINQQEREFVEFHEANPHVYAAMVKVARDKKSRGFPKYGIMAIINILRW